MKKSNLPTAELRRQAEARLSKQKQAAQPVTGVDTQRLLYELEVHQIELEMQNEELRQARAELEAAFRQYTDLYDFAPVGYFTLARDSTIRQANLAGANLLWVEHNELTRRRLGVFVSIESRPAFNVFFEKLLSGEGKETCELAFVKKGDEPLWARLEATCFEGGDECRAMLTDITERKRMASLLQARVRISEFVESHTFDELLQKTLDEAEVLTGSQTGFVHFLEADQKTLKLQMWSTNTLENICTAEGKGMHYAVDQAGVWADCVSTRAPLIHNDYASLAHRKGLPQGHAPILRELVVPVLRNDLIVMIMGVGNKSTDYDDNDVETLSQLANLAWDNVQRKQTEEALKISEKKYRLLHESMIDGFVSVDMDGKFLNCNEIYRNLLGYSEAELAQLTYVDITPENWHAFEADLVENQILKRGYSDIYEKEYRRKDGTIFPVELHTVLLRDEQGKPVGMWAIVRDITERKRAKQALEAANTELQTTLAREQQLARTDSLTGVSNRRYLYELAEHEFEVATRYRQPLSAIMFDIDRFKKVNDLFGHMVGDQMLERVAQAACAELRSADVIGRYGGEEFIILLPMTNAQQAYSLAERIRVAVAALRVPTPKGDASVTLSIGIVEIIYVSPAESVEDVFRRADVAMYTAKQAGRNRTEIFNPGTETDSSNGTGAI